MFNPTPNIGKDGSTAPDRNMLVAGKDGSGNAQDLSVTDDGHVNVVITGGSSAGTQYTEGDTDASITGTAVMWEDTSNTLRSVSATYPLPVEATIDTTGLATSANQTTIIGHIDGVETLLTAIDADTSDIHTNSDTMVTALQLLDDTVFADDAAYTLGTSKANVVAGVAVETDGTDPSSVAEGDAAAIRTTRDRIVIVTQTHPRGFYATENHASAQTNNELVAAPGANLSLYITDVIISNGATAGSVKLVEDTGGTPVDILEEMYFAINGGAVISLKQPKKVTANKNLGFTSTTVTTHSVTVSGYIAP